MPITAFEGLHGRLAVDHGGDDVPILGVGLLSHDHPVAIGDRRFDHGITRDSQQEQGALTDDLFRQREDVLDYLLGEHRTTSGDPANYRNEDRPGAGRLAVQGLFPGVGRSVSRPDTDCPGTVGVAAEVSLALQSTQLVRDR
jgi:hypothetical protein